MAKPLNRFKFVIATCSKILCSFNKLTKNNSYSMHPLPVKTEKQREMKNGYLWLPVFKPTILDGENADPMY